MKIILSLFLSTFFFAGLAQEGNYKGAIKLPGIELEVELKFEQKDGKTSGEMDIPMQNAKGLTLNEFKKVDDSLHFEAPDVPGGAIFMVAIQNDSLLGRFTQSGKTFPFEAAKLADAPAFSADSLKSKLQELLEKTHVPGMAVGIIHKGKIILNSGFGYANLEDQTKVDENTVFAIGSSSKAFTAALLSKCVEDELITWDEPVSNKLNGFGMKDPDARNLNSEDLLTHRSGLPRHDLLWYGSDLSREELLQKIKLLDYTEPFRTKFQYQNLMYMAAGMLAGELRGKTWEALLQEQILDPLNMTSSSSNLSGMTSAKNKALPYIYRNGENMFMGYRNIDAMGPAGSINSTSTDMLKWVQMLLNNGKYGANKEHILLRNQSIEKMTSGIVSMGSRRSSKHAGPMYYGMGWMINDYKHKKMVHHGGNIDGFSANVMFMPSEDLGVVILTNANGTGLTTLATLTIADMVLGLEPTDWYAFANPYGDKEEDKEKEKDKKDKKAKKKSQDPIKHYFPLKDYAGTYENEVYGDIEVRFSNDSLLMTYNGFNYVLLHQKMEIFAATDLKYGESQNMIFRTDINGDLSSFEFNLEPSLPAYEFSKKPNEDLFAPEYLEQFTGEYKMDHLKITVSVKDGKLWTKVSGQGEFELTPKATNKFTLKEMPSFGVEFILDKKGETTGLITHQPNGDFEGKKVK